MKRKIPQISAIKGRQVLINKELQHNLEMYAKFQAKTFGGSCEPSDVLSFLCSDQKRLQEVQPASDSAKVHFRMTSEAWENLDATAERTGLKLEAVIEEISAPFLRDRDFIAFKASPVGQEPAVTAVPKKSRKAKAVSVPVQETAE